jgi:hypothetical protein
MLRTVAEHVLAFFVTLLLLAALYFVPLVLFSLGTE